MASSSTNSSNASDNQTDKSDSTSELSDESKKGLLTSSSDGKEAKIEQSVTTVTVTDCCKEQQDDFPPHLIQKRSIEPLSAWPCSLAATPANTESRRRECTVIRARPFEEFLVIQPDAGGPSTKSDDGNSSSNKRLA